MARFRCRRATAVKRLRRRNQPGRIQHRTDRLASVTRTRCSHHLVDVVAKLEPFRFVASLHLHRRIPQLIERQLRRQTSVVGYAVQTSSRSTDCFPHIGRTHLARILRHTEPGKQRPDHRPLHRLHAELVVGGNVPLDEHCLDRDQAGVDSRQHGNVFGVGPRRDPFFDPVGGIERHLTANAGHDPEGFRVLASLGARFDRLVDSDPIPRQQICCCCHNRGRAPIVGLQRIVGRAGEPLVELGQEPRIGAAVAVDHLIVVAHAIYLQPRRRQKTKQQHIRRREILELVDQQMATPALPRAPQCRVAQQHLDCAIDLLSMIDAARRVQPFSVGAERFGEIFKVITLALDPTRTLQAKPHLVERFEIRRYWIGVGPMLHVHKFVQQPTLIGLAQQRQVRVCITQDRPPE